MSDKREQAIKDVAAGTEELKGCFNCGSPAIGISNGGLLLCRGHFDVALVAGWEPVLFPATPAQPSKGTSDER